MLLFKKLKKTIDYLTHPLVLALPLTIIILLLLPPFFEKYKGSIENVETFALGTTSKVNYVDLDNDGYSEKVQVFNYQFHILLQAILSSQKGI